MTRDSMETGFAVMKNDIQHIKTELEQLNDKITRFFVTFEAHVKDSEEKYALKSELKEMKQSLNKLYGYIASVIVVVIGAGIIAFLTSGLWGG